MERLVNRPFFSLDVAVLAVVVIVGAALLSSQLVNALLSLFF